jgi:peroxiredoxin family protein
MIAVILASGAPDRLYTALSLLVSAAAEGEEAHGLATFGALPALLADALPPAPAEVVDVDVFDRTLAELRATAEELPSCRLWACAAAVETLRADPESVAARFAGVRSTPRFLAATREARLVVV